MAKNGIQNIWEFYSVDQEVSPKEVNFLFLCHNTKAKDLRSILHSKYFNLTKDKNFKKKLSFFYLGRPIYCGRNFESESPCILVFKAKNIKTLDTFSWAPFDSGSLKIMKEKKTIFATEYFSDYTYKQFKRELVLPRIGLENAPQILMAHIEYHFESYWRYLFKPSEDEGGTKILKETLDPPALLDSQKHIHKLYSQAMSGIKLNKKLESDGYHLLDERIRTLEGHRDYHLDLLSLDLVFAYTPENESGILKKIFHEEGPCYETYKIHTDTQDNFIEEGLEKYKTYLSKQIINEANI